MTPKSQFPPWVSRESGLCRSDSQKVFSLQSPFSEQLLRAGPGHPEAGIVPGPRSQSASRRVRMGWRQQARGQGQAQEAVAANGSWRGPGPRQAALPGEYAQSGGLCRRRQATHKAGQGASTRGRRHLRSSRAPAAPRDPGVREPWASPRPRAPARGGRGAPGRGAAARAHGTCPPSLSHDSGRIRLAHAVTG